MLTTAIWIPRGPITVLANEKELPRGARHEHHYAPGHIAGDPARQRRTADHAGGRRRRPCTRRHTALLAPPRYWPAKLPHRSQRPLLAERGCPLARRTVPSSTGRRLSCARVG